MSKLFWLHPLHIRFLLKYYVPFVLVAGPLIGVVAWSIGAGYGWIAFSFLGCFIAGLISGAATRYFVEKRKGEPNHQIHVFKGLIPSF